MTVASYGLKNLGFLERVIQSYQSMPLKAKVVVLSEAPKSLGPAVEVIVGLPSRNPWSLPFAHKPVLARNVDHYDLFVYSEDDIGVTVEHLQAFLRVNACLNDDEVVGFLRYEENAAGARFLPDVHGAFHFEPESVSRRGEYTIAKFTNEHAGFYVLTQAQLRRALGSGGFLRGPTHGRYPLPETAATDVYTCCGLRKVVCVSHLGDFLIHHLPNRYLGYPGLPLASFKEQIEVLLEIASRQHPVTTLCPTESSLLHGRWAKSYYEKPCPELLALVPHMAKDILSVGCGWGALEVNLQKRGAQVTALPLDSVIGGVVARRGIEMVYGSLTEALEQLKGRSFDCVVIPNLLHLQAEPGQLVSRSCRLVREGGTIILSGPSFGRLPTWGKRLLALNDYRKLRTFEESGINLCGPRGLTQHVKKAGLRVTQVRRLNDELSQSRPVGQRLRLGRLTARDWLLQAMR